MKPILCARLWKWKVNRNVVDNIGDITGFVATRIRWSHRRGPDSHSVGHSGPRLGDKPGFRQARNLNPEWTYFLAQRAHAWFRAAVPL